MKKYNQPQTEITQVGTYSLLQVVSGLDLKNGGKADYSTEVY